MELLTDVVEERQYKTPDYIRRYSRKAVDSKRALDDFRGWVAREFLGGDVQDIQEPQALVDLAKDLILSSRKENDGSVEYDPGCIRLTQNWATYDASEEPD